MCFCSVFLPGFTVDEVTEETYAVGVRQAQEVQDWTVSQLKLVGCWVLAELKLPFVVVFPFSCLGSGAADSAQDRDIALDCGAP